MNEIERALALLIILQLGGAPGEEVEEAMLELKALLFTLKNRRQGHGPYHKTYRGTYVLEVAIAAEEGREPQLISEVEFLQRRDG